MRQLFRLQTLYWAVYAFALFIAYNLVVKVAFIDLSWIALVIFVPLLIGTYFLIHKKERRQVIIFTIGFLLLDKALTTLDDRIMVKYVIGAIGAIIAIALLVKFYGKVKWNAVFALVAVACLTNFTYARDNLAAINHFVLKAETDRLYKGEWVDYFPITLYDIDGDGTKEILTFGNADEVADVEEDKIPETPEEKKATAEKLLYLKDEPLSLYVLKWKDGKLVRLKQDQFTPQQWKNALAQMPTDYPGFPYYAQTEKQLVPTVQRQSYTEAMMQSGTAPFRALLLDLAQVDKKLTDQDGYTYKTNQFNKLTKFHDVEIKNGFLTGSYGQISFQYKTRGTKILDTMRLPDGQEGLLVLDEDLAVITVKPDATVEESYRLNRKSLKGGLAMSDIMVADIDHDNKDELLIGGVPSYILRPTADGKWEMLFASSEKDTSFRLTNYASIGKNEHAELIAQAKSWVSSFDRRYLSGFDYTQDGLKQNWKIYLPLIKMQVGDIDGDQENELVATMYDNHRILVFKRHQIPVFPIAVGITIALFAFGIVRRVRYVSK
ncbi:hypothetical protein O0550_02035 [Brevibacillus halotolerans]|uniref:hypothetical protein n=1 Tax=Brevibacillus TaxID=55080 RepID=UPI00215BEB72|nr:MULTISPECIES: hypothetical protein [Brevibacillus]MCR8961993.1 hypothetical protein [Brevibacillus laterosporus]MCZ0834148.1 hypothetical protein [Brevibacillus halotolerans]